MSKISRPISVNNAAEEKAKMKRRIEGMLAKAENYWNKLLPDHRNVLSKTTNVMIYSLPESAYLEKDQNPDRGFGMGHLLGPEAEMTPGTIYVNLADPTHLHYYTHITDRKKMSLLNLNTSQLLPFKLASEEKPEEAKEAPKITVSSTITDTFSKTEETKINSDGLNRDGDIYEGQEAVDRILIAGVTEPEFDPRCLFLLVADGLYLFLLFDDYDIASEWSTALKLLVKAQDFSYRGTKDEYPLRKKEYLKEIARGKEWRTENKDRLIVAYVLDLENESFVYRELKIYTWCRNVEVIKFFIYDIRKIYDENRVRFCDFLENEDYLNSMIFKNLLQYVEVGKFYIGIRRLRPEIEEEHNEKREIVNDLKSKDTSNSKLKGQQKEENDEIENEVKKKRFDENQEREAREMHFLMDNPREGLYYYTTDNDYFWDIRRKIIKAYKVIRVTDATERINNIRNNMNEVQNTLLQTLKQVELQKQLIRVEAHGILKRFGKYRGKRGKKGEKGDKSKAAYENMKKTKKVEQNTSNVLKYLMLENIRPELIPDKIKKFQEKGGPDDSRGCCSIS